MRHLVLAAALLGAGAAFSPASAQYYDHGPSYGYGYETYGPPRRVRARPSNVCITARGPCPIGEVVPQGWPCGCIVPGFGYKRGNAG